MAELHIKINDLLLKNINNSINEDSDCELLQIHESPNIKQNTKYNCYSLLPNELFHLTIHSESSYKYNYDYLPLSLKQLIIINNGKYLFSNKINLINLPNKITNLSLRGVEVKKMYLKNKLNILVLANVYFKKISGIIHSDKIVIYVYTHKIKELNDMKTNILDIHIQHDNYFSESIIMPHNCKIDVLTLYVTKKINSVKLSNSVNKLIINENYGLLNLILNVMTTNQKFIKRKRKTQNIFKVYFACVLFEFAIKLSTIEDKTMSFIKQNILRIILIFNIYTLININMINNILLFMTFCYLAYNICEEIKKNIDNRIFSIRYVYKLSTGIIKNDLSSSDDKIIYKKLGFVSYYEYKLFDSIIYFLKNKYFMIKKYLSNYFLMEKIINFLTPRDSLILNIFRDLFYPAVFIITMYLNKEYQESKTLYFINFILLCTKCVSNEYNIINDKLLIKNIPKSLKTIVASREYKQLSQLKKSKYNLDIEYND